LRAAAVAVIIGGQSHAVWQQVHCIRKDNEEFLDANLSLTL
jgi:hypothetical protein